jgi:aminomethyltransferase
MVPFAGYSMPVQYPAGLMAEHHHTRAPPACSTSRTWASCAVRPRCRGRLRSLMPVDVIGLGLHKQRYGLLLNDEGGIIDDLMFVNRGDDIFVIVNGACKHGDLAHIQARIGGRCRSPRSSTAPCWRCRGPQAVTALQRLVPGVEKLVFMTGMPATWNGADLYITRSGYTGEDGFEISVPAASGRGLCPRPAGPARGQAHRPGRAQLAAAGSRPVPVRQRHRHHHHAGRSGAELGHAEGAPHRWRARRRLPWRGPGAGAARRHSGARQPQARRPGRLERVPVREHTELQNLAASASAKSPAACWAQPSTSRSPWATSRPVMLRSARGARLVRGKAVPMEVVALPFVPNRYYRG